MRKKEKPECYDDVEKEILKKEMEDEHIKGMLSEDEYGDYIPEDEPERKYTRKSI
jgi:hypothetical protein